MKMRRTALTLLALGTGLGLLILEPCAGYGQGAVWRPEKTVEIIAPATAGGLHDLTARSIQQIFQARELVDFNTVVVNKGGARHRGMGQHPGDGHWIAISAVNLLTDLGMARAK
jgi:hypothetical protein